MATVVYILDIDIRQFFRNIREKLSKITIFNKEQTITLILTCNLEECYPTILQKN